MKVHPGRVIWIGLYEPGQEELAKLQRYFGLHELAVEDAYRAHQRPKLELYGETMFVVMKTAQLDGTHVAMGETSFFIGRSYVITVRHGPSTSYSEVRARCENTPENFKKGEDFILYALMDFIVDRYFPIVDSIEDDGVHYEQLLTTRDNSAAYAQQDYYRWFGPYVEMKLAGGMAFRFTDGHDFGDNEDFYKLKFTKTV